MDWNYAPRGGDCQLNAPKPSAFSPQAGAAPLMCDIQAWQEIDPPQIPRLRFVYGDTCAARYPSATFAALKTGKSLLALSEAIDAATARRFLTGKPSAPIKVLRYNAKDELAVIQGRVAAVLQAWQIPQSEIISRLFPVSGVAGDSRVVLTRGEKGDIFGSAFLALADLINREGVALAIFDPLQDLSHSPETNEVFRALASEIGATIGLVHHMRKPTSANAPTPDDGRGRSALRGVAHLKRLLVPATKAEGAQADVDDFLHYFRIKEPEANLAPPSSDRLRWIEKSGGMIANSENVATIRQWLWPEAFSGVTFNDACKVRSEIAARETPPRENSQTEDWAGQVVAEVLDPDLRKKSERARVASRAQVAGCPSLENQASRKL